MQSRLFVTAFLVAALLTGACGSSAQSTASPAAAGTTIGVASNAKLGKIIVDGAGKTLYLFVADTGSSSTCYTACAQLWPPVLTSGSAQAGTGATASLLGTTTRKDGKTQVTYGGHPLYYFVSDKQAGDATGQGVDSFGGLWWVVSPSGTAVH